MVCPEWGWVNGAVYSRWHTLPLAARRQQRRQPRGWAGNCTRCVHRRAAALEDAHLQFVRALQQQAQPRGRRFMLRSQWAKHKQQPLPLPCCAARCRRRSRSARACGSQASTASHVGTAQRLLGGPQARSGLVTPHPQQPLSWAGPAPPAQGQTAQTARPPALQGRAGRAPPGLARAAPAATHADRA
jgi:hypothetical protein